MKTIVCSLFPVLFSVLFTTSASAQLAEEKMLGKVKYYKHSISYTTEGGTPDYSVEVWKDENGKMTNSTMTVPGITHFSTIYRFDKITGLKIEEEHRLGEEPGGKSFFLYNEKNLLTNTFTIDVDGTVTDSIVYVYDKNGNVSVETHYNGRKNYMYLDTELDKTEFRSDYESVGFIGPRLPMEKQYLYSYDNDNRLIWKREYNSKYMISKTSFQYDPNGKLLSEKMASYKDSIETVVDIHITKYNKSGQSFDFTTTDVNGKLIFHSVAKYDKQGNMISISREFPEKEVTIYKFKYDKQGNWISKTEYKGKKWMGTDERIIEYYK
jgi:hypothetical protein